MSHIAYNMRKVFLSFVSIFVSCSCVNSRSFAAVYMRFNIFWKIYSGKKQLPDVAFCCLRSSSYMAYFYTWLFEGRVH